MNGRLLVVVDEPRAAQPLTDGLVRARFRAEVCLGFRSAYEKLRHRAYDAIVVDLPVEPADAVRLSLTLRERTDAPVIFLSRGAPLAREAALIASGAGYPPYHDGLELPARATPRTPVLRFGGFAIDLGAMHATQDDVLVELTPTEFKLLVTLAEYPGRVLSREELLLHVWGYADGDGGRLVDVHVGRLRKKLAAAAVRDIQVRTARGFGYRLGVTGDVAAPS